MSKYPTRRPEGLPEPEALDYKLIAPPLAELVTAELNFLRQDRREPQRFRFVLWQLLTACQQTYKAIARLAMEAPTYPAQARTLVRCLVEALFTIVLLAQKPAENAERYEKSGYRDMWEYYQGRRESDREYPEWRQVLDLMKQVLQDTAKDLRLSKGEQENPTHHIKPWPNPSVILRPGKAKKESLSENAVTFLTTVKEEHYAMASQLAHMTWFGGAASVFATKPEEHWNRGKFESDAVCHGITFLLMITSEIEAACNYKLAQKLRYLWTLFGSYWEEAKDYYDLRYDELLAK